MSVCVSETEIELCAGRNVTLRGDSVSLIEICRVDVATASREDQRR